MSLKAMLEKQKAAAAAKQMGESNAGSAVVAGPSGGTGVVAGSDAGAVPDSQSVAAVEPAKPTARLNFGVKKPTTHGRPPESRSGAERKDESTLATSTPVPVPTPAATPSSKPVPQTGVMSLDDLADSTDDGLEPATTVIPDVSGYADEIPATAPARELPADLSDSQRAFVVQLDSIYEIVHDPELFGNMIRTIMQELQEQPEYMNLIADQDVHTMIRGLRSSMGLAKIKKAEKATKSRGSKKAPPTTAMANTLDEMFNSEDW